MFDDQSVCIVGFPALCLTVTGLLALFSVSGRWEDWAAVT